MKRRLKAKKSALPDADHPKNKTRQILVALPLGEQRIVRMRFGIDSEVYSAEEVARLLRIPEPEVRAVEDKFLGRFRQNGVV